MRQIPAVHTKYQREMYVHKVRAAIFVGAFLSFFVGACLVPWAGGMALWVMHWIGWKVSWSSQPGGFPGLLNFIAVPNLPVGLLWLLYYVVSYFVAKWRLSPREIASFQTYIFQSTTTEYSWHTRNEEGDDVVDPLGLASPTSKRKRQPVLSRACPGELKHQLVERCYQEYRKALLRYDQPPVDLKTPPTFYYARGVPLGWNKDDQLPILPEELLTPERIHLLLAPLAQHLAWYNSDEPHRLELRDYPDFVPWPWLLIPTGNCLWLPVMLKHHLEVPEYLYQAEELREQAQRAAQFACYIGQGSALEHLFRRLQAEREKQGLADTSFPTLSERIGHLEVMNKQEREQMRQLGLTPQEPPLVKGEIPPQLYPGRARQRGW